MENIDDLFRLMQDNDILDIATEAEDITDDVTDQGNDIAKSSGVDGSDGSNKNNGEISTDVDNLFGTKKSNNDTSDSDSENNIEEDPKVENEDEPNEEDSSPNTSDDTSNDPIENNDSETNDFEKTRKIKAWKNLNSLHNIISDAIDLISKFMPDLSDPITIKAMSNIKENLVESKRISYNTLTEDHKTMDYKSLQRRYEGLMYIYDLCSKELEVYFDKYHKK